MSKGRSSSGRSGSAHATGGFAALAVAAYGHQSADQALRLRLADAQLAIREVGPVIYGVLLPDGLIKIGHTEQLMMRLRKYRISRQNLQRLLMVKGGGLDEERAIHRSLEPHRAKGKEYYHPDAAVIGYINSVRRTMGIRSIAIPGS
jgi:hypothetical protein